MAAAAVREHLEICPRCAERDAALLSDHELWVRRIRSIDALRHEAPAESVHVRLDEDAVPGYRVLEEIGRGGQGVVYRAVQLSTRRDVAIKLLASGPGTSDRGRRRFEREIEMAAGLQHPNIVHILDSGVLGGGVRYVVMEHIRGAPLLQHARARGGTHAALRLFAELCDGVNHAHQQGVIHRDLKPSNVLVDEHGRPRILDFGLACAVDRDAQASLTLPGQIGGTLAYMSPEQARGLRGAGDVRSDVYSLGVMLFEMLTGRLPYATDGDVLEALKRVAEAQAPPPSRAARTRDASARPAAAGIDTDLDTIVLTALAKEPERRYQTAGALADELRRYLAGQPIAARRDSTWYLLRKSLRRYRLAVSLTAALFATVCVSAVTLGWMYLDQRRLSDEARRAAEAAAENAAEAQRAQAQAESRFEELRALARDFIFELDPLIRRLPGSRPARERIVATGLRYIDALAAQAADRPDLQFDLAGAYLAIGDVQGDVQSSSGDDLDAALESYAKAVEILERLARELPEDTVVTQQRVFAMNKIGQAYHAAGRRDEARAAFERALRLAEAALESAPENEALLKGLGDAHERLGNLLMGEDREQAERHYEISMEISRRAAERNPDDLWMQRSVGVAYTKLANLLVGKGDVQGALEHYREFVRITERSLEAHPHDIALRQDALTGLQWIGILLGQLGEVEPAVAAFERSAGFGESLLRDGDLGVSTADGLTTTYIKLGEVQLAAGMLDAARVTFDKAHDRIAGPAAANPDRRHLQRLLGVVQYKLLEHERAAAQAPGVSTERRLGHWRAAADWAEQCRRTFVAMRERGILAESDAGVPEELAAEVEGCLEAVRELEVGESP